VAKAGRRLWQAERYRDAHAGATQQSRQQRVPALQLREHGLHFLDGEHHWQSLRPPRPLDLIEPWQFLLQHRPVQEQQSRERLVLSRGRDAPLVGQHRQVRLHLGGANLARIPPIKVPHEAADPVDVLLLGSYARMAAADLAPHRFKQRLREKRNSVHARERRQLYINAVSRRSR
jgi:hypothetical protein